MDVLQRSFGYARVVDLLPRRGSCRHSDSDKGLLANANVPKNIGERPARGQGDALAGLEANMHTHVGPTVEHWLHAPSRVQACERPSLSPCIEIASSPRWMLLARRAATGETSQAACKLASSCFRCRQSGMQYALRLAASCHVGISNQKVRSADDMWINNSLAAVPSIVTFSNAA